jgi:flagellar biogenesis protein FliO
MTGEELEQMQRFFTDQAAFLDRQQAASDTLQDWLRWLLLLLLLLEVLWVLKRLLRPETSTD